jgi:TonB family protein
LPEGVYRAGNGVTRPEIVSTVGAQSSEEARLANLTGTVKISLIVGEDGGVSDVRALTSLGLGLDEAAIAAVSKWHFKPGLKDAMPVSVSVNAEVGFRPYTRIREKPGRSPFPSTSPQTAQRLISTS